MRTSSSSEARPEVRREKHDGDARARAPVPKEEVDQFRQMFERRDERTAHAEDPARQVRPRAQENELERRREDVLPPEMMALLQSHRMTLEVPAPAPTLPPPAPGLADLIEKHVRQMLVSESGLDQRDARVMMRMADTLMPGTDLTLTRDENGWALRADVTSVEARDALRDCAPDLVKRFGSSGLGEIRFEAVLRG